MLMMHGLWALAGPDLAWQGLLMLMMHGSVGLRWVRSGLARAADAHDPGPVGPDPAWQGPLMLMMHGLWALAGPDLAWQGMLMLMMHHGWVFAGHR